MSLAQTPSHKRIRLIYSDDSYSDLCESPSDANAAIQRLQQLRIALFDECSSSRQCFLLCLQPD